MLSAAVDSYLAIRRTLGFRLRDTEMILRDFAAFASAKEDTHVSRLHPHGSRMDSERKREPVEKLRPVAHGRPLRALPPCRRQPP